MISSMIDEFPKLNEDFTRKAQEYLGGNLLFMTDGSGGMTVAYGNDVNPDPIVCTLSSALSIEAQTGLKVLAKFWGEPAGCIDIDMRGNEDSWHRQMPNGQTLLQPALEQLVKRLENRDKAVPLHIIFVSDGVFTDGDPNAAMEKLDALRKIPGVVVDVIITEKKILLEPFNRAPLAAMAHTLNRSESGYDIGVAHADGPEMLKAAIHDFIEARMQPEVQQHAHTEATVEATKSGLSHSMRALKPPSRWKAPEST